MTLTWDVFLHFWRVLWECGVICRIITFLYMVSSSWSLLIDAVITAVSGF